MKGFITSNIKNIIISTIIAIFLLVAGYFGNNMSILTGESLESFAIIESVINFLGIDNDNQNDSVIYINTSYDKTLIKCYEKGDFPGATPVPLGNTQITDRLKLIKFLELIKDVDYKYLIIDIKFAKGLESDSCITDSFGRKERIDDKLISLIKQLDRVVVATNHDIRLMDTELEKKAALADYRRTATATNFVRYEYFDSIPYIPTTIYNDIRGREGEDKIECHYPFGIEALKPFAIYTQGYRLCYNSLFIDFNISDNKDKKETEEKEHVGEVGDFFVNNLEYYNLSNEILNKTDPEDIVNNFKGKYIYLGNLKEDRHDTYAGPQPGCVILSNALKALENQKHVVSWIEFICLFIIYLSISFFIIKGYNLFDIIKKSDNPLLHFVIDTTSFTIILFTYQIIEFILGRPSLSFVIPIIVFSVLKTYKLLNKKYNMKNKFIIFVVALLSGFLMSFTPDDEEKTIEIHSYNSSLIRVDNKEPKPGSMISLKSIIKLNHPKEKIILLNRGKDFCYFNKAIGDTVIWKKGDYLTVQISKSTKTADLFWWIIWNGTISKSLSSDIVWNNVESVIGDKRPFAIEDKLIDFDRQYYEFLIFDGTNKVGSVIAYPDDEVAVIWITKEQFKKYLKDRNSVKCKVVFHNYDDSIIIKDKMELIFEK